jgi:hypothetical protein
VYVCYLPHAPSSTILTVEGEWTASSAGGRLSAAPGAKWRSNPQYRLKVEERCTLLIAISQQDSQTDANDASDAYPHAIGFHVIGGPERGPRRTLSYVDGPLRSSRYANSRQVCRVLELEPSSDECVYNLMPATWEPNVYMPYTITLCASKPVTLEPVPTENDYLVATALGSWSAAANTAGGCPNFPETWTNNPQIRLTTTVGGSLGIGVLSLTLPEVRPPHAPHTQLHTHPISPRVSCLRPTHTAVVWSLLCSQAELKKLQATHEALEKSGDTARMLSIGVLVMPIADAETGKAPGDKPALNRRLTSVALAGKVRARPLHRRT